METKVTYDRLHLFTFEEQNPKDHNLGEIELSIKSNDQLLAGYRIRIGDDVYEDSVASRLENLKKSFL